ncbi:hypothetical protein GMRT_15234 [Giardia muris]|uniref:Uncharacterized protein n=1 Tax=Giardia muris TaxID=5742 RepID=A0A4Z1SXA4_GIAMU|nr:hypothetical protein GMRT_15234 [Giardia muris]|eukprot:TNJ28158.1 hypothetical protein GMRT_15234 [Giardia muris]
MGTNAVIRWLVCGFSAEDMTLFRRRFDLEAQGISLSLEGDQVQIVIDDLLITNPNDLLVRLQARSTDILLIVARLATVESVVRACLSIPEVVPTSCFICEMNDNLQGLRLNDALMSESTASRNVYAINYHTTPPKALQTAIQIVCKYVLLRRSVNEEVEGEKEDVGKQVRKQIQVKSQTQNQNQDTGLGTATSRGEQPKGGLQASRRLQSSMAATSTTKEETVSSTPKRTPPSNRQTPLRAKEGMETGDRKLLFTTNLFLGTQKVQIAYYDDDTPEVATKRTMDELGTNDKNYETFLMKRITGLLKRV